MNAKYHRLQEKIQMLSKIKNESIEIEEQPSSLHKSQNKSSSLKSSVPIPQSAKLEIRLKTIEDLYESAMESIAMKHNTLETYIAKIKSSIDSFAIDDDKARDKQIQQVCSIEKSLILQVNEESHGLDLYLDNSIKKIESTLVQIETKQSQDCEIFRKDCMSAHENAEKDLKAIAGRLEAVREEEKKTSEEINKEICGRFNEGHEDVKRNVNESALFFNSQYEKVRQIGFYAKQMNQEEAFAREEFNANIVKVLNETEETLNNY